METKGYDYNLMSLMVFNFCEAGLWVVLGVVLLITAHKNLQPRKGILVSAAICLFVFGLTDIVEVYTGAWWRPFWLLILKGVCIIYGITCIVLYRIK